MAGWCGFAGNRNPSGGAARRRAGRLQGAEQRGFHVDGAGEALQWDRRHRPRDHRVKCRRRSSKSRWRNRLRLRRRLPGQRLVEQRAERVDVGSKVQRAVDFVDFRRRIAGRAQRLPGSLHDRPAAGHRARQAEIPDPRRPVIADENVPGLDVAVQDAFRVRVGEAVAHLADDPRRPFRRQPPLADDNLETPPGHKFHHEVRLAALVAEIIHRHDVRMVQPRHRLRFACEPFEKFGVPGQFPREDFQGHQPIERNLACPIDRAHSAGADQFLDDQVRKTTRELLNSGRGEHR